MQTKTIAMIVLVAIAAVGAIRITGEIFCSVTHCNTAYSSYYCISAIVKL
jgi:hypothetical protein